jgi:hypothetical protein
VVLLCLPVYSRKSLLYGAIISLQFVNEYGCRQGDKPRFGRVTVGSSKLIEFFIPFADLQHVTHTHTQETEKKRIE